MLHATMHRTAHTLNADLAAVRAAAAAAAAAPKRSNRRSAAAASAPESSKSSSTEVLEVMQPCLDFLARAARRVAEEAVRRLLGVLMGAVTTLGTLPPQEVLRSTETSFEGRFKGLRLSLAPRRLEVELDQALLQVETMLRECRRAAAACLDAAQAQQATAAAQPPLTPTKSRRKVKETEPSARSAAQIPALEFVLEPIGARQGALCSAVSDAVAAFARSLQQLAEAAYGDSLPAPPAGGKGGVDLLQPRLPAAPSPPLLPGPGAMRQGVVGDLQGDSAPPGLPRQAGRILLQLAADSSYTKMSLLPRVFDRYKSVMMGLGSREALMEAFESGSSALTALEDRLLHSYATRSSSRVAQQAAGYHARLAALRGPAAQGPRAVSGPMMELLTWLVSAQAEVAAEAPGSAEQIMYVIARELSGQLAAKAQLPGELGLFQYLQARLDISFLEKVGAVVPRDAGSGRRGPHGGCWPCCRSSAPS